MAGPEPIVHEPHSEEGIAQEHDAERKRGYQVVLESFHASSLEG